MNTNTSSSMDKKNEINYINNTDIQTSNSKISPSKEETRTNFINKLTKRINSFMPMKEFKKIFNFVINEQQILSRDKQGLEKLVDIIENENIKSFDKFKEIFLNGMKETCKRNNIQITNNDNIKFNNLTDYINFFKNSLQDQNNYDLTLENFITDNNNKNITEAENKFNNAIKEKNKLNLFEKILNFFFDYKGINKKIALAKIDLIEAKQHYHRNKTNLLKNNTRKARVYQEKMTNVSLRALNDMQFNLNNLYNSYSLTQNLYNQRPQYNQNQISARQTSNNLL